MLCATLKDYTVRKHMLFEIIKCINKFANQQKVGMEQFTIAYFLVFTIVYNL